jgi:hypothetical protein
VQLPKRFLPKSSRLILVRLNQFLCFLFGRCADFVFRSVKGYEGQMKSEPQYLAPWYKGSEKLKGKVAIVTGGDSGIGRSVSILYAREGASVAIVYHKSHDDANHTKQMVEKEAAGGKAICIAADLSKKSECNRVVKEVADKFGTVGTPG